MAVTVRAAAMLGYSSAVLNYYGGDSGRYARLAPSENDIFSDPSAPAGYPVFLRALREVWDALSFTVAAQHALGIATGVLLYLALRRLGAPWLAALLPAAVVLLSGDQVFLEHALLAEALWSFLIVAGLYAAVRGAEGAAPNAWLVLAGVSLMSAVLVRQVAFPLVAIAALWALYAHRGPARGRVSAALAVVVPALVLLAGYLGAAHASNGNSGLGQTTGWQLYGRVAQFADCTRFDPPAGTEYLCESTAPKDRLGPGYYLFGGDSPYVRHLRPGAKLGQDSEALGRFARRVIVAQTRDYASAVLSDAARYLELSGPNRIGAGADADQMSFDSLAVFAGPRVLTREYTAQRYRTRYSGVSTSAPWEHALGVYQDVMRLHGVLLIPLLLIAALGAAAATARTRAAIVLFGVSAVSLYAIPPVTALWDVRYGVPPGFLLAAAAALGGWSLVDRGRDRSGPASVR